MSVDHDHDHDGDRVAHRALEPSRVARAIRRGVFAELQARIDAAMRDRGGDVVPLHIGDTYLEPPVKLPGTIEPHAVATYGATAGLAALRRALAASLRARGLGPPSIDPDRELLVGVGATHALFCAARALLDDGDEVLLCAPYWPLAHGILTACGARVVDVPFTDVLYERPDADAGALLEAHVGPRTRAIYLITPNNPDGKVLSRAQLASVARVAQAHGLAVIADEVYADYTFGSRHLSIASLPGMAERTVSAYSFSKSHALAGARVGAVIAPEAIIAAAKRVSVHTAFNVPEAMQAVALEALGDDAAFVARARAVYRQARDAAAEALSGAPCRFALAEGGVYLFVDFRPLLGARPPSLLFERAIERGVLFAPGDAFGDAYGPYARICTTAVPQPRMLEGLARLRAAMADVA